MKTNAKDNVFSVYMHTNTINGKSMLVSHPKNQLEDGKVMVLDIEIMNIFGTLYKSMVGTILNMMSYIRD